jgi:hypothetical protein
LKHVETENSKLRNTNIILKGELSSCEEENYKLENTINSLKEQLEDYEKLKVRIGSHKRGATIDNRKVEEVKKKSLKN